MKNKDLLPDNIFELMEKELNSVNKEVESGNLSKEDIEDLKEELDVVELEAYRVKFKILLKSLSKEEPHLSLKDVIVQMLGELPSDINPKYLPELINEIYQNWKPNSQGLAA